MNQSCRHGRAQVTDVLYLVRYEHGVVVASVVVYCCLFVCWFLVVVDVVVVVVVAAVAVAVVVVAVVAWDGPGPCNTNNTTSPVFEQF